MPTSDCRVSAAVFGALALPALLAAGCPTSHAGSADADAAGDVTDMSPGDAEVPADDGVAPDDGGPTGEVDDGGGEGPCVPATCISAGASCGTLPDGCGGEIDCGACPPGLECGGRSTANACGPIPTICIGNGWCWENPLPQGHDLNAIWGTAPDDVWAVGDAGTILHWDGSRWTSWTSGPADILTGVWATAPDDVWAVATTTSGRPSPPRDGFVLHREEGAWSVVSAPLTTGLLDVWAARPDDAWVVGYGGLVARGGRAAWTVLRTGVPEESVGRVWGSGPEDVWVAGGLAGVARWHGGAWTVPGDSPPDLARSITGCGPDDVWAADDRGRVSRWNGAGWTAIPGGTEASLSDLWCVEPGDVWAVGAAWDPAHGTIRHWDGPSFTATEPEGVHDMLRGVWASSHDDVWVVGDYGAVLHGNHAGWTREPAMPPRRHFNGVTGTASGDVWIVGEAGTILHRRP
jgi:hypothetical protein